MYFPILHNFLRYARSESSLAIHGCRQTKLRKKNDQETIKKRAKNHPRFWNESIS
jgi:hypothetical protein